MSKSNFIVRGGGDFSGIKKGLQDTQKQLNMFQATTTKTMAGVSKAFKIGLGYITLRAIGGFVKATTKIASDLTEVQNVVDVTFGNMSKDINSFSKDALESFGLGELAAKKFSSTMGAMLKSSGVTGEEVKDMSINLTKLTGDMASFYNLDNEAAYAKIMSGMAGMSRPLKELGVSMDVANLEAFALSEGLGKAYSKMSQAEKTILRYNYLMSVTGDAQGDFARNSWNWAHQLKILKEQWTLLKGTIGAGFINALAPIVVWFNKIIKTIQIAAEYFKAFTTLIFGESQVRSGGAGVVVSDMADSLGDAEEGFGDVGKAGKKAGKDLKGALAGFDEINSLADKANDGAGGLDDALAGIGGVGAVDLGQASSGQLDLDINIDKVEEKLNMVKGFFTDLYNSSSIILLKGIFESIAEFWLNSLNKYKPMLIQSAKDTFDNMINTLKLWKTIIVDTFNIVTGKYRDFIDENKADIQKYTDSVVGIFTDLWILSNKIWSDALKILKDFWNAWGKDIVEGAMNIMLDIGKWFLYLWNNLVKPTWDVMMKWITKIWNESLKGIVTELVGFVGRVGVLITQVWNGILKPLIDLILTILVPTFKNSFNLILDIVGTAINGIGGIIQNLLKILNGIIDFVSGAFTGNWKKAWQGVSDIFKGIMGGLEAIFKVPLNYIISGINAFIRGLNRIKIPDFVPGVEGKGFSISEIPHLAKGGITDGPMTAVIGDNPGGREVVSPLSDLMGMIQNAVSSTSSNNSGDTTIVVKIGEDTILDKVVTGINRQSRISGKTIITV